MLLNVMEKMEFFPSNPAIPGLISFLQSKTLFLRLHSLTKRQKNSKILGKRQKITIEILEGEDQAFCRAASSQKTAASQLAFTQSAVTWREGQSQPLS